MHRIGGLTATKEQGRSNGVRGNQEGCSATKVVLVDIGIGIDFGIRCIEMKIRRDIDDRPNQSLVPDESSRVFDSGKESGPHSFL